MTPVLATLARIVKGDELTRLLTSNNPMYMYSCCKPSTLSAINLQARSFATVQLLAAATIYILTACAALHALPVGTAWLHCLACMTSHTTIHQ